MVRKPNKQWYVVDGKGTAYPFGASEITAGF